jgi:hypothetical protein
MGGDREIRCRYYLRYLYSLRGTSCRDMRCKVVQRSPKVLGEGARQKYRVLGTTKAQPGSTLAGSQLPNPTVQRASGPVLQGCFQLFKRHTLVTRRVTPQPTRHHWCGSCSPLESCPSQMKIILHLHPTTLVITFLAFRGLGIFNRI